MKDLNNLLKQGEVAAVVIRSDDEGDNMTITITAVQTWGLDSIHFDYFKFCMFSFSTELTLDLAVSSSGTEQCVGPSECSRNGRSGNN